jgi:hypothetical protein
MFKARLGKSFIMEDLWRKFKEDTKEDMQKIHAFVKEMNTRIPMQENPNPFQPQRIENVEAEISQQIVLDDEKSKNETCDVSKKISYGSMSGLVKEIMDKYQISRAQAYRKAKKLISEKSQ